MARLTSKVDGGTLKRARIQALEEGTSVDAVLRGYLEEYAGVRWERRGPNRKREGTARVRGRGSGLGSPPAARPARPRGPRSEPRLWRTRLAPRRRRA